MNKYNKEELKNLEWWRGILAFIVFLAHIFQIIWYPVIGEKSMAADVAACAANISVVLFFVLSGILVSYSAMNLSADGTFNWSKYLVNRFSRIYPSLIFVLVLCLAMVFVFPLLNGGTNAILKLDTDKYIARTVFTSDTRSFVKSFFLIHPGITAINGPLWSLVIEWWLYISALFFFIGYQQQNNSAKKYLFYLLAVPPLVLSFYGFGYKVIYYIIIWYIGCFYTVYLRNNPKLFTMLIIACLLALAGLIAFKGVSVLNIRRTNVNVFGIVQVVYAVVFIRLMFKYSGKYIFQAMSKYSYTLYIIHFAIILFAWALLRKYVGNNTAYMMAESAGLILFVLLLSRYTAKYTEDKFFFRNLIGKFFTGKKSVA